VGARRFGVVLVETFAGVDAGAGEEPPPPVPDELKTTSTASAVAASATGAMRRAGLRYGIRPRA
jgi:hypothetical protein